MAYEEPISGKIKRRHGIDFPDGTSDFQIDLMCWKYWRQEPYKSGNIKDPHELFISAMRSRVNGVQVLSEEEWGCSPWSEDHVWAWTNEDTLIIWGAGGSSKSWDFGLLSVVDWSIDPHLTITLLCSTSKEVLTKRTFASVVHYHRLLKSKEFLGFPGYETPSKVSITLAKEEHEAASSKVGIFGVAIKDGPIAEAVGRIRGMHSENVRLVVDELSAMHPAVWDAKLRYNLRIGAKSCKVVGLTNIDSWDDLAGRNSEPVTGRASVGPDTPSWRARGGAYVLRHDGVKSPAIVDPDGERKWPYLLNKSALDKMVADEEGNMDAPAIWTMVRAFPPFVSSSPTILSHAEAAKWGMGVVSDRMFPNWRTPPTVVVGLDGGYGGDSCALQRIDVGMDENGRWVLWFDEERTVPVKASAGAPPVTDQILDYTLPLLRMWNVDPRHLGIDDSGPQGLADAFARAWSIAITRFSFGSSAGDLPVSAFSSELANARYVDRSTELGFLFRMYGQYHQIRNVGPKTLRQVTSRETLHRGGKLALVDKRTFKKKTGQRSPDEMDAGGMALGVVRYVIGLAPGSSDISPTGPIEAVVNPGPGVDDATAAEYNNLESDYSDKLY